MLRLVGCAPATPLPVVAGEVGEPIAVAPIAELQLARQPATATGATVTIGAMRDNRTALSQALVRDVLATRTPALAACWRDDGVTAQRTVEYRLALEDGAVTSVEPRQPRQPVLDDVCVIRVLRGVAFPRSAQRTGQVTVALLFQSPGAATREQPPPAAVAWSPYAVASDAPGPNDRWVARAVELELRERRPRLEACLHDSAPTGSLRVLVAVMPDGEIVGVRSGGLGDAAIDACIAEALGGVRVRAPASSYTQVACDLAHGNAEAWRLAPAAGYQRVRAGEREVANDSGGAVPFGPYAVIAERGTPGAVLERALGAGGATSIVVGLATGEARAPLFLAVAPPPSAGVAAAPHVSLVIGPVEVKTCFRRDVHRASVRDPDAVGRLVQAAGAVCRARGCLDETAIVALDTDGHAGDLVEPLRALRRAGFTRIALAPMRYACRQPPPAEPEPEPVLEGVEP